MAQRFYVAPFDVAPDERGRLVRSLAEVPAPFYFVDVTANEDMQTGGWAIVLTEHDEPVGPRVIPLGSVPEERIPASSRTRVLEALGVRPITVADVFYAMLINPAPAEGNKRKPNLVPRAPGGEYEVYIGPVKLTWAT